MSERDAPYTPVVGSVRPVTQYRPEIDGLRAIAVLLVVAFHLTFSRFGQGGFIGVDVFFVISGYLITTHLRRDLSAGTEGVAKFYHRRIIRIFPALFVLYVVCAAIELGLRFASQIPNFSHSLLSSDVFASNLYLYRTVGYFDFDAHTNALIHTWSLSIEEQFYVALPLLLFALRKQSVERQFLAVSGIAIVSLITSQVVVAIDPRASFYWMPLRCWELLAGSCLSYRRTQGFGSALGNEIAGAVGLVLILASSLMLAASSAFPGFSAVPAVLGTVLILVSTEGDRTAAGRLLSIAPARFIGKISYSLYLWHWPMIVYSRYIHPAETRTDKVLMILASIVVATISWAVVENPLRKAGAHLKPRQTITMGLASIAAIAVLGLSLPTVSRTLWPEPPQVGRLLSMVKDYDPKPFMRTGTCFITLPGEHIDPQCLAPVPGKRNVLILGDSHAAHLYAGLVKRYPEIHFLEATGGSCVPPALDETGFCGDMMRFVVRDYLAKARPDAVIVSARWTSHDVGNLADTLDLLKSQKVVIFGPSPEFSLPLPEIIARGIVGGRKPDVGRYLDATLAPLDQSMRAVTKAKGATYVSPLQLLCSPECQVVDSAGNPLIFDTDHLTQTGSEVLANRLR